MPARAGTPRTPGWLPGLVGGRWLRGLVQAEQQAVLRLVVCDCRRAHPWRRPCPRGVHRAPHLEATISVARAINPKTGTNWEGSGVTPDIQTPATHARDTAYRRTLNDVTAANGASAAEAEAALAAADPA